MIYNKYYSNVSSGIIDPTNVNYSAYVVDETYIPVETHKKINVTGRIETLIKVLVQGDLLTLSMSEIIDKVKSRLSDEELVKAKGFVVYDIASSDLCFYEEIN